MTPELSPLLQERTGHPVAVFGYGVTGRALEAHLESTGWAVEIYDEKAAAPARQVFTREAANRCRTVVYSPGFRQNHPWLELARKEGCLCLAETDFAGILWRGKVIGVTGTNGKTTTCEFLAEVLERHGYKVVCAGNIGVPLVACLGTENTEAAIAVLEISSFQAEALKYIRLDHLLWTNFSETHLDQHGSLSAYFLAKWNLTERASGGRFIAGEGVRAYMGVCGAQLPEGMTLDEVPAVERDFPESSAYAHPGQKANLALALALLEDYGLGREKVVELACQFAPRKNRLRKVTEVQNICFWNDSKATNFAATITALRTFTAPVLWIGGGQNRGGSIEQFVHSIAPYIKRAYTIGETGPEIGELLAKAEVPAHAFSQLEAAVHTAFAEAVHGDHIVLSPGFSSQDAFTGYAERGAVFERVAQQLEGHTTPTQKSYNFKESL